jgi:type IV pilus assembly protein PilA
MSSLSLMPACRDGKGCWMFQRFHAMREEREGGFTLIELLVVILIIAILAAIAIPVFLNQRKKGWVSQVESALKNAATAQESFLTGSGNPATYADTLAELQAEGFKMAPDVNVTDATIFVEGGLAYCVQATHDNLTAAGDVWRYWSNDGAPQKASCPADLTP